MHEEVSFSYGTSEILKNVTFDLFLGNHALIGPYGFGKTNLISLLQGVRIPRHGEIMIMGWGPRWSSVRFLTGVVYQEVNFPLQITSCEAFTFEAAHFADPLDIELIVENLTSTNWWTANSADFPQEKNAEL